MISSPHSTQAVIRGQAPDATPILETLPPSHGGGGEQWGHSVAPFRQHNDHEFEDQRRSPEPALENRPMIFSANNLNTVQARDTSHSLIVPNESSQRGVERTEIPNTPTQRSSQLDVQSTIAESRDQTTDKVVELNSSSLPSEPSRLQAITAATTLCSWCQKQRVLARKDMVEVIW